jgi:hypothetical protein
MSHWTREQEADMLASRFFGLNQAEFARKFDVPGGRSMISQHIKNRRPMSLEAALAYAHGFGVTLAEISPHLAAQARAAASQASSNQPPAVIGVGTVWVIDPAALGSTRVQGRADLDALGADEAAQVSTDDECAFVVRSTSDAMAPRYMSGEYALVEPATPVEVEDDVLVRLTSGETLFRRLVSRRGGVRLGSYNHPDVMSLREDEVQWMYHVAQTISSRRVRHLDEPMEQFPGKLPAPSDAAHSNQAARIRDTEQHLAIIARQYRTIADPILERAVYTRVMMTLNSALFAPELLDAPPSLKRIA